MGDRAVVGLGVAAGGPPPGGGTGRPAVVWGPLLDGDGGGGQSVAVFFGCAQL